MIRIIIKRTEIIVQIEGHSAFSYDQINNERNIAFSAPLSSTIIFNHDKRRN